MRGRFAPTPSGPMHIGNASTALLAWLQTRSADGEFLIRIEDVDATRSKAELAEQALTDLRWLGLDWDEGPDIGGSRGPYTQSERTAAYEEALTALDRAGRLYSCFCSRAELASVASAPHGLGSEGPSYPGTCSSLTPMQREAKRLRKQPSLRFMLGSQPVEFLDAVAGPQAFPTGAGGDFIVKRADGMFSYQLAVVVDDAMMGVTDVLRGADLLDSTPRQLQLYEALGLRPPRFAHVPLMFGSDGKRLAKRHGGLSLAALRSAGIAPEEVVGWLAAVSGLTPTAEPVRASELIRHFRIEQVTTESITVTDGMLGQLIG
ncbi:tRNA glutamyl-Q(34) synthetase GluQRS [Paenibacillus sacheonensis]|uniref:Glutamyl-Q tRNA(Asp) synthetase n=1 Tax=Paenibacillus sacheonensis TaxID=742054 RepID=A0A7X5C0D9_9BACL|nr:tRNA glutamyl-Q(34) synthetase GluQRS [Paenibacillus sacheonensis]MBM7563120.1 glutamyl-tRNA synthetase [Paenibacillus sacheonensis]NBC68314.1 tRNA glutamyl-Q(34) synthetase GluQRS [Paenibacillus sacheonensis]